MSEKSMEVLDQIPFELDTAALLAQVHVAAGTEDADDIHALVETVQPVIKPKAIYKVSYVEVRDDQSVNLDGVMFSSRVLSANLRDVPRVFAHIATCGSELDEVKIPPGDLQRYWLDTIKAMALGASSGYLGNYLREKYVLETSVSMSPGAGDQDIWPIEQQRQLFSLFGNVEELIGVTLTDSFLMIPNKSVSGIRFATEINFRSCQVCQRENCPSRAALFDRDLLESYGHTVTGQT